MVADFDVQMSVDFPGRDFDVTASFRIGVLDRIGDQFVDQKSEGNRVVGCEQHWISVAVQSVPSGIAP
jgi:hypothetical protein